MIKQSDLKLVVDNQQQRLREKEFGLERVELSKLPTDLESHALIVSGIRRCGKSTLLNQLIKQGNEDAFFLNFDTPKLFDFDINDVGILDVLIAASGKNKIFFDEIQVVSGWELYIRQKLDEGFRIVITGSNASLLSRELGTKLTGRHITKELFPFSFMEYVRFTSQSATETAFLNYLKLGGFPEYVKSENPDILSALLDDILYRDIAVRYNIRDVQSLKHLLMYLLSNVGNLVTATKLTQFLGIKSTATVLDYFSYFEQTYLLYLMPKFSYSYRAQLVNPRKIYFVDPGLVEVLSVSLNEDIGRKMENVVYMELRRKYRELYYYNEHGCECDFVVCKNNKAVQLIQVCYELTPDNESREQKGLLDAMDFFKLDQGVILTLNQRDLILSQSKRIDVVPIYEFLD
jgi:predicted AAA+ superfamily ATPase